MFTSSLPSPSNPNASPRLKQLLLETIPLKCPDEKDKVYALLGLTRWTQRRKATPLEVWPDYSKSVTECMRDATCAVIREDANLDCLLLRTLTGPKPTWMVPWHRLGDNMSFIDYVEKKDKVWSGLDCSIGLPLDCIDMRRLDAPDSLYLRGLRFRKIARISPVSSEKDKQMTIAAKLRILLERIDTVINGELAKVDAPVICYTICKTLHGFAPRQWRLPERIHTSRGRAQTSVDGSKKATLATRSAPSNRSRGPKILIFIMKMMNNMRNQVPKNNNNNRTTQNITRRVSFLTTYANSG
jgi:hypothetical protein